MNMDNEPLSCAEVNNRDMVDYLSYLGFEPKRISRHHYWYVSPFRNERTASFKVNRVMNCWYDFGEGKGGTLVDFGIRYLQCSVCDFLKQFPSAAFTTKQSFAKAEKVKENKEELIQIEKVKSIDSPLLLSYLKNRKIDVAIANTWCKEVTFSLYDKTYYAIGFLNDKGGYELRNEFFKGSSRTKDITTIGNKRESVAIFEGFFDFLSYQTIHKNGEETSQNFIILNSLSFLQKIEPHLMNYNEVNLFLDRDKSGQKSTQYLLSLGSHIKDRSILYHHHKDLNDWLVHYGLGSYPYQKKESPAQ